jgi:hypothetical protein
MASFPVRPAVEVISLPIFVFSLISGNLIEMMVHMNKDP